jgi:hypothetical protein
VSQLQAHLGGFVEDEPVLNPHYPPWRQVYKPLDREDGWQDLVASLGERYASGSKTIPHIIEDNDSNERPLNPALVASIEKIIRLPTHDDYPFWRIRCKVTYWLVFASSCLICTPLSSQAQKKRQCCFYARRQRHVMRCYPPPHMAQ